MAGKTKLIFIGDSKVIHMQRWINYFLKRNFVITLFTNTVNEDKRISSNFIIKKLYSKTKKSKLETIQLLIENTKRIKEHIKNEKIDIVHCFYTNYYGWLGNFTGFHPTILTLWGSDLMLNHGLIENYLNKRAWKNADLLTVHSKFMRDKLSQRLNVHSSTIQLLRWGVDTQIFQPNLPTNSLKDKLNLKGKKIIFCPRNIYPIYDIETITKAIPLVIKKDKNIIFLFCKSNVDKKYFSNLQKTINKLKIEKYILFVDNISYDKMPEYYNLADIVLSMALSDGLPISLLEAMACGTPIIAGMIPQLNELKPNDNFIPVKLRDINSLSKAIIYLIENLEKYNKIKQNALNYVKNNWEFEVALQNMERIYIQLIDNKK